MTLGNMLAVDNHHILATQIRWREHYTTSNTNYASHNLSFATKMRTMDLTRTDVNWRRVMIENIQVIDTDLLIECSL